MHALPYYYSPTKRKRTIGLDGRRRSAGPPCPRRCLARIGRKLGGTDRRTLFCRTPHCCCAHSNASLPVSWACRVCVAFSHCPLCLGWNMLPSSVNFLSLSPSSCVAAISPFLHSLLMPFSYPDSKLDTSSAFPTFLLAYLPPPGYTATLSCAGVCLHGWAFSPPTSCLLVSRLSPTLSPLPHLSPRPLPPLCLLCVVPCAVLFMVSSSSFIPYQPSCCRQG